jgi:hypothetical protein
MNTDAKPGIFISTALALVLLSFAVSVNVPKAEGGGFKGDEATYYGLAHSLADDFDFQFTHEDLARVWQEFPGPEGIFLKHGKQVDIQPSSRFPFVRWVKLEDPEREHRLYFSKSFIYPLVAAPFVFLFGTNGFLVLHALLLSADFLVVYLFLLARTRSNWSALPLAAVFLAASVVPVYFVWLIPELFNFSLALYGLFLWSYKEVGGPGTERSDYLAAAVLGLLTFSKPPHAILMLPIVALALARGQWMRATKTGVVWALVTAALFAANAGITGEFNYQDGDRKTFYHTTGFPFANAWETFDNSGPVRGRGDLMVGDVLVNSHSSTVFVYNLGYFIAGRYAGFAPYFFPGVLAVALFAWSREKRAWQWLVAGTIVVAVAMHLVIYPFTYNGGGGPIGNRYFIAFYPLFLLLVPASAGLGAALTGLVVGALFTSSVVLNPFFSSVNPGEHANSGPLRMLPIDLTLINDLPVAQHPERTKQPLGGSPPVLAYFPDDNAYNTEGEWFWVKGRSRADVVLRAAVADTGNGRFVSKQISRLMIEVRNAGVPNRIKVSAGGHTQTAEMNPGELRQFSFSLGGGVPYHRDPGATSYLYVMSVSTSTGYVPFLDVPCEKPGACPSTDSRYLGAMIHVVPEYTDADVTTVSR